MFEVRPQDILAKDQYQDFLTEIAEDDIVTVQQFQPAKYELGTLTPEMWVYSDKRVAEWRHEQQNLLCGDLWFWSSKTHYLDKSGIINGEPDNRYLCFPTRIIPLTSFRAIDPDGDTYFEDFSFQRSPIYEPHYWGTKVTCKVDIDTLERTNLQELRSRYPYHYPFDSKGLGDFDFFIFFCGNDYDRSLFEKSGVEIMQTLELRE